MKALYLLRSGGVVGGGGAGFPTWKKLSSPAETLIINGAECEPLLQSDQYLMLHQAQRLVGAALALGEVVSASNIVIALKDHYASQRAALESAAQGGRVAIHALPTVYPVGDEQSVVFECTGRAVPPGGLPGAVGCTVVSVSTALNALAALEGVPVTRRLLTVAGEVRRPGLYDVPVGMPVSEVIAAAGGMTAAGARVMLGGPMMGALQPVRAEPVVTKTCGGILVLPSEHLLVRFAMLEPESMRSRARSCCIQCRCCTDLCPRYLLGHPIFPHLTMRAFGMGAGPEPSAALCMECGVCELFACPMGLNPRRIQQLSKEALRALGQKVAFSLADGQREYRAWRQLPSDRLTQRLQLDEYVFSTPDAAVPLSARAVRVPLRQHIGAPATPMVRVGDRVRLGQEIGSMAEGQLGASVHASIAGVVTEVAEAITIREEAAQ
jgi:Na+-translocating ferredoxin:NAD+ oxidoreductase RnfC subunit